MATGAAQPRGAGAGVAGSRSRRDNQGSESGDEGERLDVHGRSAVGPRLLEVQPHGSFGQDAQPVVGQGRTQDVPAQPFAARLVVGGDARGSLQVEGVGGGAEVALGHGAVVGVEHDADRLALGGWACGRGAGRGSGEQLGEQWVLLAQGLVRYDHDFAVARRGDERDDTAALEEA
jgi:hypothetical protein